VKEIVRNSARIIILWNANGEETQILFQKKNTMFFKKKHNLAYVKKK